MQVVEELDRERARATARINGLKEALGTAKARETKTALQLAIKEQESREARDQLAGALGKLREVAEQPGWRQSPSGKVRGSI